MSASQDLKRRAKELQALYWNALTEDVIPFWIKNSPDYEHGGYFTCLDTQGKVFDTDKFIWLQAREVWMFSKFYNCISHDEKQRREWLKLAKLGADFLKDKGKDDSGSFYFSVEKTGKPLIAPYNIFSDCFAAMAFAQYYKASKEDWAKDLAEQTFEIIEKRKSNPKGKWTKAVSGTRPFKSLAVPMIDINLCMEMREAIPTLDVGHRINQNIDLVFSTFLDERGFFRESVCDIPEGNDSFEGRLVCPGHTLEALWFIMDTANKTQNLEIVEKAANCMIKTLEFGWDEEFGGIFYFLDRDGKPPQELQWDQKLWWVHLETLVALALAFEITEREEFAVWYNKVHEYSWNHFPDPKNGEWFGYLNRRGEVLLQLKGGKWKGFFHVPRALYLCSEIFKNIAEKK